MSTDVRVSPFSIVPVEAALDHRLTAMHYRVLVAILSFRSRNSDTVYPRRQLIAQRCGYTVTTVSKVTAQLEALGWLHKTGRGGRSKATEYRVTVPDELPETLPGFGVVNPGQTVPDPETVSGSETVSDPGTVSEPKRCPGRAENGVRPGHTHGRDQEHITLSPARPREAVDNSRRTITWRNYQLDLSQAPAGLTDAVVIEWLDARRAERRPCNQSTVTLWMRELARAVAEKGWEADRALTFAMGWQNFSADWLDRYSDEAGSKSKGAGGEAVDEAWQRLLRHCRQGQNIAQVEHASPDLAPAARELGGMAYLRGLTEREMQFQFQKFRSLYQQPTAASAAGGG